jgi:hypothetical protein
MDEHAPQPGPPPIPHGRPASFLHHPLFYFFVLVVFSYQVKEFYPFTHIPMYSDPEARAPYMFLADSDGHAIGVRAHCGVTNPKMRKMYHGRLKHYCRNCGIDPDSAAPEIERVIALEVIAFLREQAIKRNRPLPENVRLMNAVVIPAEDGFAETKSLLAQG